MTIAYSILVMVVLQRVGELWYASTNTTALKARGGIEYGRRHYLIIVTLHCAWLIAIAIGVRFDPAVRVMPLILFVLLQAVRVWVLATMGRYWTTWRIRTEDAALGSRRAVSVE